MYIHIYIYIYISGNISPTSPYLYFPVNIAPAIAYIHIPQTVLAPGVLTWFLLDRFACNDFPSWPNCL